MRLSSQLRHLSDRRPYLGDLFFGDTIQRVHSERAKGGRPKV